MSEFFSGSIAPFWPHSILLTAAIASSFAVAAGIVLENPKLSLANVLVVGGVTIEAVCTLLLFGFDEGISGRQQSTIEEQNSQIIALEMQIAPRRLSKDQFEAIQEIKGKVQSVSVLAQASCLECAFFSFEIVMALQEAGVSVKWYPGRIDAGWKGIYIFLPTFPPKPDEPLFEAFTKAFVPLSGGVISVGSSFSMGPIPLDIPLIAVGEKFPAPTPTAPPAQNKSSKQKSSATAR